MAIHVRNFVMAPVRAAFESVLSRPEWGGGGDGEEDEHAQLVSGWVSSQDTPEEAAITGELDEGA
ncbi:MAG: hypothetical protein ACWA5X_02345 [bacterium]